MKAPAVFSTILFVFFAGCSSVPEPDRDGDDRFPASTPYGDKVIHLKIPPRLSQLEIEQAILNAAVDNRWQVMDTGTVDGAGMVEMRRKTTFAETTFTFLFRRDLIEGFSDSFSLDITGKPTRRYTPPIRIDTIRDSIRENLEAAMAGY
ncbi:MAG: hypothetical protein ACLFRP_07095 [Puniceicoccaceae bacterium]